MNEDSKKRCYRCNEDKQLCNFIQRVDSRHYNMCRTCVSEILLASTGKKKRLKHTATHRTCYLCRRILPAQEFTKRSNGTYFSACRECNKNVFSHRRRARLAGAEGSFTTEEWEKLLNQYDHCPGCLRPWDEIPILPGKNSPITRDHIIPIAKGGGNRIENIQPLCYSCNSKKGDRLN